MGTRKPLLSWAQKPKKEKKWLEPHSKASEMVNAKIPRNQCNFETDETWDVHCKVNFPPIFYFWMYKLIYNLQINIINYVK